MEEKIEWNKPFVIRWDWKAQPDFNKVNEALEHWNMRPYFYTVDTDSDDYAVVISPWLLEKEEAVKIFEENRRQ